MKRPRNVWAMAVAVAAVLTFAGAASGSAAEPAARPVPFVPAMLAAFRTHDLVALGDAHGSSKEFRLVTRLIADPRFARRVQNVVVQFGNARFQAIVDAFVSGKQVGIAAVSKAWTSTTQPPYTWSDPVYRDLFVTVRTVNKRLAPKARIRILLGDPPVDRRKLRRCDRPEQAWRDKRCIDYWYQAQIPYFASTVRREVLARHERALLIASPEHFWRDPKSADRRSEDVISRLERFAPGKVFSVIPYAGFTVPQRYAQRAIEAWPAATVATIARTTMAAVPARSLFAPVHSTPNQPRRTDPRSDGSIGDLFDAWLYLGRS